MRRQREVPAHFPSASGFPILVSMTTINEIAPDLFRLAIYVPSLDIQFNHFLVRDEEPLLSFTRG